MYWSHYLVFHQRLLRQIKQILQTQTSNESNVAILKNHNNFVSSLPVTFASFQWNVTLEVNAFYNWKNNCCECVVRSSSCTCTGIKWFYLAKAGREEKFEHEADKMRAILAESGWLSLLYYIKKSNKSIQRCNY